MATTFLEPGGDATFNTAITTAGGFWGGADGNTSAATDFVHGGHKRSIKCAVNAESGVFTPSGVFSDSGTRFSFYLYINALPSSTASVVWVTPNGFQNTVRVRLTSAGILQLWEETNQIGSNGGTLTTGRWYRISLAYTITSTVVNRFELFVDAVSSISVTNATLTNIVSDRAKFGNYDGNSTLDIRMSDFYMDNSSSLTDTGDVWVTAKRPNANGTATNFTTQIGSGGSGYGTGHSPQVNERAASTTNGWSVVNAGAPVAENYNIENISTGDMNLSASTIVDYVGWVYASALVSESASINMPSQSNGISITSTPTIYTGVRGTNVYPPGTGSDIGITTDSTVTTVSLYECGIIFAFIPPAPDLVDVENKFIAQLVLH